MSLTVGSNLGPYEITALLGAGGMGEVYRARDKRLDRVVAIKVLPSALSARPDLRQRLEREARTISSLNHPNICTLFDVGETPDGSMFLVMEILEGETLAERLTRGALPPRQALRFGAEIAEALDRAHRQGIVHRDLKPANVMITKTGVKLLDFGLAKLITNSEAGGVSDPNSPTVQHERDVTAEGMIVGTLQYMSPEQLEGKVADARSDIFALGATLYEMFAGQRAFQANSRAGLIANILHSDPPPLTTVTPGIPPQVSRLVEHCLMKEPDDRWQTARDVAIQLRGMADASSTSDAVAGVMGVRRVPARAIGTAVVLLAIGAAAVMAWQRFRDDGSPRSTGFTHLSVTLSEDAGLVLSQQSMIAISPDGTKLVFRAVEKDKPDLLYLRRLDTFEVRPIAGTENTACAFFSPDGKELAFASDGELKRLVLEGGTPEKIANCGPSPGGSWGSDGMIVFQPIPSGELHKVPATGGTPLPVPNLPKGASSQSLPLYRPDIGVLFYVSEVEGKSFEEADIVAVSLESGQSKVIARGTTPRYVTKSNTLVFVRAGKIWSVAFDPKSLSIQGTPSPVAEPVLTYRGSGESLYDVSADGDVIYVPNDASRLYKRLMRVSRDGTAQPLPFPPDMYEAPGLSRDGRLLSLEIVGANNDVWLGDMQRGTLSRLTSNWENLAPVMSPDASQIIVSRHRGNMPGLHVLRTDGVGEPRRVAPSELPQFAYSWSDDGTTIAFVQITSYNFDLHLLNMAPEKAIPLLRTRFLESEPALSPDSRWIAYVSNETGKSEVYLRATNAEGTKIRVSTAGGSEPLFAHNGRELFYRNADAMMVVRVTYTPSLSASEPVRLFDFPSTYRDINRGYDVYPDDQSFVMIERSAAAENMRMIHVIRGAVK